MRTRLDANDNTIEPGDIVECLMDSPPTLMPAPRLYVASITEDTSARCIDIGDGPRDHGWYSYRFKLVAKGNANDITKG